MDSKGFSTERLQNETVHYSPDKLHGNVIDRVLCQINDIWLYEMTQTRTEHKQYIVPKS